MSYKSASAQRARRRRRGVFVPEDLMDSRPIRTAYIQTMKRWPKLANLVDQSDGWKVTNSNKDRVFLKRGSTELITLPYHAGALLGEIKDWQRFYLPPSGVRGKVVLDIGAGCGETAAFYFSKGAKKVVAVESDPKAAGYLQYNRWHNSWNLKLYREPFNLSHLDVPHDFLKMDIEGGEGLLVNFKGDLGPCVIESHSEEIARMLLFKGVQLKKNGVFHLSTWGSR